jgi:hypothetical protein
MLINPKSPSPWLLVWVVSCESPRLTSSMLWHSVVETEKGTAISPSPYS